MRILHLGITCTLICSCASAGLGLAPERQFGSPNQPTYTLASQPAPLAEPTPVSRDLQQTLPATQEQPAVHKSKKWPWIIAGVVAAVVIVLIATKSSTGGAY